MQDYTLLKADALLKLELFVKVFVENTKSQILESADFINPDFNNLVPNTKEIEVFRESLAQLNDFRCKALN